MLNKEDYFIASNRAEYIPRSEYDKLSSLIYSVKAFARTTYQSLYLIDLYKQEFIYVSDNPLFLCGHTAEEVRNMGYQFYLNHVPEEEQLKLIELNNRGFKKIESFKDQDKYRCILSYDFHLRQGSKKILINHKLTPIMLTDEGKVWIALCVVSLSPHKLSGHVEFHLEGSADYWDYSFEDQRWNVHKGVVLKECEKEVLRYCAEGMTNEEIAVEMSHSVDTIKFYKRNLFEKLEVSNIKEAMAYVTSYKLL